MILLDVLYGDPNKTSDVDALVTPDFGDEDEVAEEVLLFL